MKQIKINRSKHSGMCLKDQNTIEAPLGVIGIYMSSSDSASHGATRSLKLTH